MTRHTRWSSLLAAGLAICCATGPYTRSDILHVDVESFNLDLMRVRVFCERNGALLDVVRGLAVSRHTTARVSLGNCVAIKLLVEAISDDWLTDPILVHPGDTLRVQVPSRLPHTTWTVR